MEKILDIADSLDMNVLHRAVKENRLQAVKGLLNSGVRTTNIINDGQTPLHLATTLNYHSIMAELVKIGSRKEVRELIDSKTFDTGSAALHIAARNNSIESMKILLNSGANFEIEDDDKRRPIDLTMSNSIEEIVTSVWESFAVVSNYDLFVSKLKSCPLEHLETTMYARNSQGFTTLQIAIEKGYLDTVTSIIDHRIEHLKCYPLPVGVNDVDYLLDKLEKTSKAIRHHMCQLERFCRENDKTDILYLELSDAFEFKKLVENMMTDASKMLVDVCKERLCDPTFIDQPLLAIIDESLEVFGFKSWFTDDARLTKMLRQNIKIVEKLLKMSIVVPMQLFVRSTFSSQLLHAAENNCSPSFIQNLLDNNADVNQVDDEGLTALHYALCYGNTETTELLLDYGADPTGSIDKQKATPLQAALTYASTNYSQMDFNPFCNTDAIKLHLDRMSNEKLANYIDAKDEDGSTALHIAVKLQKQRLIELFLSKGAIYCIKDADDKLPEDYADLNTQFLFRYIDELFTHAFNENTDELMKESLRSSQGNTLLAVCGARNDQGLTLLQVLDRDGCADVANEIKKMLVDIKRCDE